MCAIRQLMPQSLVSLYLYELRLWFVPYPSDIFFPYLVRPLSWKESSADAHSPCAGAVVPAPSRVQMAHCCVCDHPKRRDSESGNLSAGK